MSRQLVPDPPDTIDPLVERWPAGQTLYRVHGSRRPPTAANPGPYPHSRFAFFGDPPVPVLYAAEDEHTAVAETLLHDIPHGGRLLPAAFRTRIASAITTDRNLHLAQLHSGGLKRLGLRPRNLTDTSPAHYPRTVRWAHAIHRAGSFDGLVWMSRQWNSGKAVMLFADRIRPDTFTIDHGYGRVFTTPHDFDWLADMCTQIRITAIPPW